MREEKREEVWQRQREERRESRKVKSQPCFKSDKKPKDNDR